MKSVSQLALDLIEHVNEFDSDDSRNLVKSLNEFMETIFLELPEQRHRWLASLVDVIGRHIPGKHEDHNDFHRSVIDFWQKNIVEPCTSDEER